MAVPTPVDPGEGNQAFIKPSTVTQAFLGVGDHDGNRIAYRHFYEKRTQHILADDPAQLLADVENETITELNSKGVGGDVDELVLRPKQAAVWIHRKTRCQ